jgi:hypothetical protein
MLNADILLEHYCIGLIGSALPSFPPAATAPPTPPDKSFIMDALGKLERHVSKVLAGTAG